MLPSAVMGLLPTPSVADGDGGHLTRSGDRSAELLLPGVAKALTSGTLLKTPTAQLAVNGGSQHPDKRKAGGHGPTLADQVEHELLPTPAAWDWKSGQSNLIGTNARPLNEVVEMLLPTPAAHDSANTPENHLRKKPGRSQVTSLQVIVDHGLLPSGGRMDPPSVDGKRSLAGQHPGQLSLGEPGNDFPPPSSSS